MALAADASGARLRRRFDAGGYYVLGSEFETPREVRIVVDAGSLGFLAIAAHGHADALSFTLSVSGCPMLIDPGTYAYHTHRRWRDYFRGTAAHNTVRVDHLDQSVSGGTFLWNRHANARCLSFDLATDREQLVAEHDGYRRLDDPVIHRREITYEREPRVLTVTDQILSASVHHIEILWHFAQGCVVTLEGETARATRNGVELRLQWPVSLQAQLVRGSTDPAQGWVSHRFDEKVPADTLVVSGRVQGGWRGVSTLTIS
jgi:hypothetical protein